MTTSVTAGAAPDVRTFARTMPGRSLVAEHGPLLLADLDAGPSLAAHRDLFGAVSRLGVTELLAMTREMALRGRGGAGFPFATKLQVASRGRHTEIVVNVAEGEPASAKDAALAILAPHRVLDGAALAAAALGTAVVHVVVPLEREGVAVSMAAALAERRESGERVRWRLHEAEPGFVSGQAQAVLQLLAGRPNLPVTAWVPEAVAGHRGRPTLLSNAETWAHVGALARLGARGYAAHGTATEPGTTLLTLGEHPDEPTVVEVAYGTPWSQVLRSEQLDRPVLLGGYHGTWAAPGALWGARVSRVELAERGLGLGAGVVVPLPPGHCPVRATSEVVDYLAGASAGRCGPCRNGLPALAGEVSRLARSRPSASRSRVAELMAVVERRGACAHPDGTVRLVRSLLSAFADEVADHLVGVCRWEPGPRGAEFR
jgi:NADH:ubiquinone oxidoreductase subunit F (NADH-binding)